MFALGRGSGEKLLVVGVQTMICPTAALGVVFTTLFAAGLLSIRLVADSVHIDPDCVLYGSIETVVMDTWPAS